jgi:hypothetical protein
MKSRIIEILKDCSGIECEDCILEKIANDDSYDCGARVLMKRFGLTDFMTSEEIADRILKEIKR